MKAVVWRGIGDIRLDDVPDPKIEHPTDAVIRLTASAICGTDLHFVRGTFTGMEAGTILGRECVGIIEQLGSTVRNFDVGDRVVVCSKIACGTCSCCRAGYYAQCDNANPNGPSAGTSFFGGPADTGPVNGLKAERARIPHAAITLVKVPDEVTDDQAILISDIFPPGWYGALLAAIGDGDTVAVFGCGPGRAVRHRLGAAARRRAGDRRGQVRRPAGDGPAPRRIHRELRAGRPGEDDQGADRRHRRGPGD